MMVLRHNSDGALEFVSVMMSTMIRTIVKSSMKNATEEKKNDSHKSTIEHFLAIKNLSRNS